jgi:hypothetical protein
VVAQGVGRVAELGGQPYNEHRKLSAEPAPPVENELLIVAGIGVAADVGGQQCHEISTALRLDNGTSLSSTSTCGQPRIDAAYVQYAVSCSKWRVCVTR